jgi:hypothetical protein
MRLPRLEWISLLYLAFFVFAVISPQVVSHGMFGLSEERIEEILIFCFGLAGLTTFTIYERAVEKKEKEHEEAVGERDRTKKELVSSYEYIGAVNRRMEALKELANTTAIHLVEGDRLSKEMFQSLAASAAAVARTEHGAIRIVALDRMRTLKEFAVDHEGILRVANRDLRIIHDEKKTHAFVTCDDGSRVLIIPSSRRDMTAKAFLLIPLESEIEELDIGLLNVYANQAEVLYRILSLKNGNGGEFAGGADETPERDVG